MIVGGRILGKRILAAAIICGSLNLSTLSLAATVPTSKPLHPNWTDEDRADFKEQKATLGGSPFHPFRDFKEAGFRLFDKPGLLTLAGGAFVAVGSSFDDEGARDYFAENGRLGVGVPRIGNEYLGTGLPGVALGATLWGIGYFASLPYETHAGQAHLEALLATGLLSAALKGTIQRPRPNDSDNYSFPSSHSSTVFASATALYEFYGWKVGIPAFALGTLTAISRLSVNEHWLSDTVSGAVIGIWMGQAFSRAHLHRYYGFERAAEREKGAKFSFYPVAEPGGGQLMMNISF
jgi:hypothetical protein